MPRQYCSAIIITLSILLSISCFAETFPPGDLDYNAKINLQDIEIFADQWLNDGCKNPALINHWKFDERTGNYAYDEISNNTGFVRGENWLEGKIQGGLFCDGGCTVDINDIQLQNNWTISFWMYISILQDELPIGSTVFGDNTATGDYFYAIDNNKARFVSSNFEYVSWEQDTDFYKKWRFVTLVADTNSVELYLDSISQGKQEIDPPIKIAQIATGHTDTERNFIGIIDDFRIYNQPLTLEEIQYLNRTSTTIHNCADIDQSGSIDMQDFAQLANYWQQEFGPVVINELMASNENCIADEYNNYSDWIELYNPTDTDFDIGGMYVSDSKDIWQIPANHPDQTTIPAHSYLLLWADGSPSLGPLHVDFKLSAGGESVILYESDASTIVDSIDFDEQTTDVSFGRAPDLSDNWKLFTDPTPKRTNSIGYTSITKPVYFSVKSKCFTDPFYVNLTTDQQDAVIYYTTNGTKPDLTCDIYTDQILINETTIIRAIAKSPKMAESNITSESYIQLSPEVADFNSNLPIFIIESFGDPAVNSTANEDYIYNTSVFINKNENERAYSTDTPEYIGRSGIRVRGSSTAGTPKHQYAFETWDEYNADKNVSIFGLPSESDWVIQGPYSDKTLMRNYLVYNWSNLMGQYAPRIVYMEGFINIGGGPITMADYVGVYYFMEKIKVDKNRVAVEKITPYDNTEPQITGGYILKNDRADPGDPVTVSSMMGSLRFDDPGSEELTEQQINYMKGYIGTFETALTINDFNDPEIGYAKYADVNSFIDSQILVELAKNIDGYRLSTYMHKDRNGKLTMGPAWDYNLSLGNAYYNQGWNPEGWYYIFTPSSYKWYEKMFGDIEFHMNYIDRWFSLREGLFSADSLLNMIDQTAAYLDEGQQRNFERWKIIDIYSWPNPGWGYGDEDFDDPPLTYPEHIDFMKDWLAARVLWMDSQFIAPPIFNQDGGKVQTGFELTMELSDPPQMVRFIDTNEPWRYLDDGSNQYYGWTGLTFDDQSWSQGNSPFGYGEGDENTVINYGSDPDNKYITTYFRKTFEMKNLDRIHSLTLKILCDDGAAIYLNDTEILPRLNVPDGRLTYKTLASTEIEGEDENTYVAYELDISMINEGKNYLCVEVHQASADSNDMSFDAILEGFVGRTLTPGTIYYTTDTTDPRLRGGGVNPNAIEYTSPVTINENTIIKARELDETNQWSALNKAVFTTTETANALRITEIMYHPADYNNPDDPNTEFIELTNTTKSPINLNLVHFRNGIDFTFGNTYLNGGEYIVVVKDIAAFQAKYGTKINIAGQYSGSLDNSGERIRLTDALDNTILDFEYKDGWYPSTDGLGASLVIRNEYNSDPNSWSEKGSWMPSSDTDGNPGKDDPSELPVPDAVVINEILSNPGSGQSDWIELHNTTDQPIDISGWFLSDSDNDFTKFQIADSTIIPAGGYTIFYQSMHFGNSSNPGCNDTFGLSSDGETVYLRSGKDGQVTGYYYEQKFGASITATSMGRHIKSTGQADFVAMSQQTPAAQNAYPAVGPIIFNEIMYHPQYSSEAEYVVLYNITSTPVTLQSYDSHAHTNIPWAFIDGIDYTFPPNTTIPANGYLVIAKDPDVFNEVFGPTVKPVLGPFNGQLSNDGEKLELAMPTEEFDNDNQRIYITMEKVEYNDKAPWPTLADGYGYSLFKRPLRNYSNDPINWQALQ